VGDLLHGHVQATDRRAGLIPFFIHGMEYGKKQLFYKGKLVFERPVSFL
jgi:hypothetical protein